MIQTIFNKTCDFIPKLEQNILLEKDITFTKKEITDFLIDYKGVLREVNPECPNCKCKFVISNGYTSYDNKVFTSFNLKISKGQYLCKNCKQGYFVDIAQISEVSKDFEKAIKSLIISLRLKQLSFPKIKEVISEVFNYNISEEKVREIFNSIKSKIITLTSFSEQSGYYSYDVQYFKISGRDWYRHTIHDLITGKVIIDTVLPKQTNKIIKKLFLENITAKEVKSFVVDMANGYPTVIRECFGPNVQIQWCLFHLFQDIKKKYKGCKKETETSSFQNELNKQLIFDIIYPRQELIDYLNQVLQWLHKKEEKLKYLDKKTLKKVMKKSRAFFWREYRKKQSERRKEAKKYGYKIVENFKTLEDKFKIIYSQKKIYPKKIKSVLEKMQKNWDRIILFCLDKKVPPTNNVAERYFGKTCSKHQKKKFRSVEASLLRCKIHFLQENGVQIYETHFIFNIITKYSFIFAKFSTIT